MTEEDECGITYEHRPNSAGTECRECGADLSSWAEGVDDFGGE